MAKRVDSLAGRCFAGFLVASPPGLSEDCFLELLFGSLVGASVGEPPGFVVGRCLVPFLALRVSFGCRVGLRVGARVEYMRLDL